MSRVLPRIIIAALALTLLSACSDPQPDLKSPCVCVWRPANVG